MTQCANRPSLCSAACRWPTWRYSWWTANCIDRPITDDRARLLRSSAHRRTSPVEVCRQERAFSSSGRMEDAFGLDGRVRMKRATGLGLLPVLE